MTIDLTTEIANLDRIEDTDRIIITGMEYKHLCSEFSEWNDGYDTGYADGRLDCFNEIKQKLKKNSYSDEEFFKELDDRDVPEQSYFANNNESRTCGYCDDCSPSEYEPSYCKSKYSND